jgi:hypothetical protein
MENMDKARRHRLGTVFDIELMAASTAVVALVWIAAVGVVVSFVAQVGSGAGERLLIGLAYGLLMGASIIIHQLGGAVAGGLLGAPMRSVIVT